MRTQIVMDNHLALTRWHVATCIPDVFAFHFLLLLVTRKDSACVCVGRKSMKEVYKIINKEGEGNNYSLFLTAQERKIIR